MSEIHANTETKRKIRKLSRTAVTAIAIAAILCISALAVGISVYASKQAEVRDALDIGDKNVPEYTEYDGAGASSDGQLSVTVLSSMHDAQFQWFYLLVEPVSREDAESLVWDVYLPNINSGSNCTFAFSGGLEASYDGETQSLILRASFPLEQLYEENGGNAVSAVFSGYTETPIEGTWRSECQTVMETEVVLVPSERRVDTVSFAFSDGLAFTNPETGGRGVITGADVSSSGITWYYSYEGASEIFLAMEKYETLTPDELTGWREKQTSWLNAFDSAIADAVITLSDGSTVGSLRPEQTTCEYGMCSGIATWVSPIEIGAVASITVCGQTFYPLS